MLVHERRRRAACLGHKLRSASEHRVVYWHGTLGALKRRRKRAHKRAREDGCARHEHAPPDTYFVQLAKTTTPGVREFHTASLARLALDHDNLRNPVAFLKDTIAKARAGCRMR